MFVVRFFTSLKLTVACLFSLMVLIYTGTLYQGGHGLFLAQERFFYSWFLLLGGVVPFPGGKFVLWLLFLNLMGGMLFHFRMGWRVAGILCIHLGLLIMLVGGWVTHLTGSEGFLTLNEGEASNLMADYREWELSAWEGLGGERAVFAIDDRRLAKRPDHRFNALGVSVEVLSYFKNARAFQRTEDEPEWSSVSGIDRLEGVASDNDPQGNIPALVLRVTRGVEVEVVMLYGGDVRPTLLAGSDVYLSLRRKRTMLPAYVELLDFKREYHPNSDIPKAYASLVEVTTREDNARSVIIEMNKPFRYAGYTFYQASFAVDKEGGESSTFAVTLNYGRLLPYIATTVTVLGLLIHFLMVLSMNRAVRRTAVFLLCGISFMGLTTSDVWAEGALSSSAEVSLESFDRIPVVANGRKMPMDSFARHVLLSLSGRTSVKRPLEGNETERIKANRWLAEVFYTPSVTRADPVFLINHPEVLQALGITPKKRRRYAFVDIAPHLKALDPLRKRAEAVPAEDRSLVEKGFLKLYGDINVYLMLVNTFDFARPSEAFMIEDVVARERMGLPKDQMMFSYFDLFRRGDTLGPVMQVLQKPQEEWTPEEKTLFKVAEAMFEWSRRSGPSNVIIVPMSFHGKSDWLAPADAMRMRDPDQVMNAALHNLAGSLSAYVVGDDARFSKELDAYNAFVLARATDDREVQKSACEVSYNRAALFMWCKPLYLFGFIFSVCAVLFGGKSLGRVALLLVLAAFIMQVVGLSWRVYLTARPPVTNLYGTFVFVSLVCVALGLIVERMYRNSLGVLASGFIGYTLLMIAVRFGAEGDTMGKVMAVLNSNFWLSTHVIAINMGYAGVWLAGVLGHVYLIQSAMRSSTRQRLKGTFKPMMGILAFGMTFSFLGTMLGGVWADQSWGRFWGWDPKENGALLIVLWTALIYHARMGGLIKDLGTAACVSLANIVVMFAWLGVNVMGVGLHSYGFTSGIARGLQIYYWAEVLFVGLMIWLAVRQKKLSV